MAEKEPLEDPRQLSSDLHVTATYRLTEALVEAGKQMRRRLDRLSEIVFETSADGRLVFVNQAWTALTGRPAGRSLGQELGGFVVEEDRLIVASALTREVSGALIRLLLPNDAANWMELSTSPIESGGAIGTIRDVTQQKLAQDEARKLSLVASNTSNLVIITDREGRTEWVNNAFVQRTGFSPAEMIGRKPGAVLQGENTDQAAVQRIRVMLRRGVSFKSELLNYTKSGVPYWVELSISPIFGTDGAIERFIAIQTDTTQLHLARKTLEAAKERAERANAAKTLFLATVSHEMRTPLNAIIGSIELLQAEAAADTAPEGAAHILRIVDSANDLLRLIAEMLDISKIEAGQIDLERVAMEPGRCILEAVAASFERARAKGLDAMARIDAALPRLVMGDPDRLRQIVSNLVENAVKFTEQGFVRVSAAAEPDGTMYEIVVADSGPGIPPAAQAHVFERFAQGDGPAARRKTGAGLGLNIVKSLVEAQGGRVTLTSVLGEGSVFRVCLPLEPAFEPPLQENAPLPPPSARRSDQPARVLVAEDNEVNFQVILGYLARAGYVVQRARNGLEAVAAADGIDLILMDVEMPELDGLEATRRIRAAVRASGKAPVPVLAITAHAIAQYRDQCLAAGCTGYLAKPVRLRTLLDAVAEALG